MLTFSVILLSISLSACSNAIKSEEVVQSQPIKNNDINSKASVQVDPPTINSN
jgi:hypothetical protein